MKNKIVIIITACIFLSCGNNRENRGIMNVKIPTYDIYSQMNTVLMEEEYLAEPEGILAYDDYIILYNNQSEYLISVYNIETGKMQKVQKKGNGPMEMLNIDDLGIYSDHVTPLFYAYDDFKEKLFVFELNDLCRLSFIEDVNKFQSIALDDNLILGSRNTGDSRFWAFDKTNGQSIPFGDYSEYKIGPTSDNTLTHGYIELNTDSKVFAWFSIYGESCNFFNYSSISNIVEVSKTVYKPLSFVLSENFSVLEPKTVLGFMSLTSSCDRIYALHNGKTLGEFLEDGTRSFLCDNICMFDWDGNYICRLKSARPMRSISYNKKHNKLFAAILSEELEYKIVYLNHP